MTVSANLPLASYAAGLDDMIAKTVELRHECDALAADEVLPISDPRHRQRREDPAALEWRVRASVDAMQACHFTTTELQIMLALALDRLA